VILLSVLAFVFQVEAATVVLSPIKDNTLYEDSSGSLSNGAGHHIFVGKTDRDTPRVRRGLIAFDIAENIPAGSRIDDVTLTLHMSRTTQLGSETVSLHRLLADWGEGASVAGGNEGQGGQATNGDVTWLHTFSNNGFWNIPGGDFVGTISASLAIVGIGDYTWGPTDQMIADVQAWLNGPLTNFGWLLSGNEAASRTAKRFDSKENDVTDNRPELVVDFVTPLEDPIPEPILQGDIPIQLETVATGLTAPNWGIFAPGLGERLFVTDQNGILWNIDLQTGNKTVFLDVSDRLVELGIGGPNSFDERGLLGVAFHPDYATNGLVYTYTSEPLDGPADFSTMPLGTMANHQSVIIEWQVPNPINLSSVVDPSSARELMRIDQPQFNHDGGAINFSPDPKDRMLYIALGDGGAADDMGIGHVSGGNGQDPSNVLGSFLRIDPQGDDSRNGQYGILDNNPFFPGGDPPFGGQDGCADDFCDEIYAYVFRNPFRFSFDSETSDLVVGDVGQNDIEEVDMVEAGGNYGWSHKEGTFFFDANGDDPGFVTDENPGGLPPVIDPIGQYDHDEGIAIIGGFVYRGTDVPELVGKYVFGDLSQQFFGNNGRLFYLAGNEVLEFPLVNSEENGLALSVLGFGQDANGEIYVLGNTTGVPFGDTGVVLKISCPCEGDFDQDSDVDGKDLVAQAAGGTDVALQDFTADFGRNDCPPII
jgi:glucose/arabinose dehydrogenase